LELEKSPFGKDVCWEKKNRLGCLLWKRKIEERSSPARGDNSLLQGEISLDKKGAKGGDTKTALPVRRKTNSTDQGSFPSKII